MIYPRCDEDLDCRLLPTFKFEPNRAGQQNDLVYHYEHFKPCHRREQTGGRCLQKAYNCPFDDCKCIQIQPCSEKLSQDDYCNQLAKLRGVTPYPLLSMDVVMKDIGSQNVYNSVNTLPANPHPQTASL